MTHILLISYTERVKQVFESLEKSDFLQLRTAATLDQADQDIAASAPEFTFVQSRILGLSGEILLRHLNKILPAGAKIILLAGDADELKQARKHGACLDLTLSDEALAEAVKDLITGVSRPRASGAAGQGVATPRSHHSKTALAASKGEPKKELPKTPDHEVEPPVEVEPAVEVELPAEVEPPAKVEPPAEVEPPVEVKPPFEVKPPVEVATPVEVEPPVELQPPAKVKKAVAVEKPAVLSPEAEDSAAQSFAEIMQRVTGDAPTSFEVDDRVTLGKSGLTEGTDREETAKPVSARDFSTGEPLADAMRRSRAKKKERPVWIIALALALVCIPVFSYLAGKKTAPTNSALAPHTITRHPNQAPPAQTPAALARPAVVPVPTASTVVASAAAPAKPGAVPAAKPAAVPATKPAAVPATKPAAVPAAKPTKLAPEPVGKTVAKPAAPAAKPAAKAGLKSLPPILSYAKLDAAYAKTHPGWQRYLGSVLEYKLFKEAELYRAMQVLARRGESVPAPLFKRILQEFGGTDGYRLEPAGEKGKYLVEKGETKNGVAITLYRNKADHRMKAFVLYYH